MKLVTHAPVVLGEAEVARIVAAAGAQVTATRR